MDDVMEFAAVVLIASVAGLVSVMANRLTERLKVPAPLLVLAGAAVAAHLVPKIAQPSEHLVEQVVTVALILILFDGGRHIGLARLRDSAGPIALVGVLGTFATVVGAAVALHLVSGIDWYLCVLVATAVSPTDPAVVFSVLGRRELAGRSGTVLEGESGANDPVGIALMASLLAAGSLTAGAVADVGVQFALQMGIGLAVGVVGGWLTTWFVRNVELPSEGLYPLRSLACALLVFGAGTLAHGSGFLAVFVAGIVGGDAIVPFHREVGRFHAALAGLAEIVAFVVLGLTVDLHVLVRADVLVPGLVLAAVLTVLVRPAAVVACLLLIRLRRNEKAFVAFAGLKGAVPILLGVMLLAAHVPDAERLYGIVVVVVVFSVLVQGSLVPAVAGWLRLPMRTVDPTPWAVGVRVSDHPDDAHRLVVGDGSPVVGRTVDEVAELADGGWVSLVVRAGALVAVRSDTVLAAGDVVVVLADADRRDELVRCFSAPAGR